MGLEHYKKKRDFAKTPEPAGARHRARKKQLSFVVQEHDARRLHYDFRLELDGVLLSWAVPKGPSLDPSVKRLAVQTEDHPLEYARFEGTIPEGEYGAGSVAIWDHGSWTPEGDGSRNYQRGRLTFSLHGEKLKGRWHLVRTSRGSQRPSWLLFKADDEQARHGSEAPPARNEPRIELTNPDKVLYPEQGVTKRELLGYYAAVAELMLPHVVDRPLMLRRCPEGRHKDCFFQKHAGVGLPAAVRTFTVQERGKQAVYTSIADAEGLFALVQLGVLEVHTWGARRDRLERPDLLVMDLDPDPALPFSDVIDGALALRELLLELGLQSFVKTTGGKGLHVTVPVERRHDWDETKAFCKALAELLERADPRRFVASMSKARRQGKIFVDYLRNARGATFVAPYSTRARPGATVALPLDWGELRPGLAPEKFTLRSAPERLAAVRDPWADIGSVRQSLTSAMRHKLAG